VGHDLFKFTTADENGGLGGATIDSLLKSIVGFSYGVKSPRQTKSGLSWLPKLDFHESRFCVEDEVGS
jgi:hypothetical protein